MRVEKKDGAGVAGDKVEACRSAGGRYEPPRVEKSRRLAEITGQGAVVPSGAPVPPPPPPA